MDAHGIGGANGCCRFFLVIYSDAIGIGTIAELGDISWPWSWAGPPLLLLLACSLSTTVLPEQGTTWIFHKTMLEVNY